MPEGGARPMPQAAKRAGATASMERNPAQRSVTEPEPSCQLNKTWLGWMTGRSALPETGTRRSSGVKTWSPAVEGLLTAHLRDPQVALRVVRCLVMAFVWVAISAATSAPTS